MLEKLQKVKKRKTTKKLEKIERMLDQGIGYVHENYIAADALHDVLLKNPYLVKLFGQEEKKEGEHAATKKRAAEAEMYTTKGDMARAFNNFAEIDNLSLTYDQYLELKEHYKNIPFFKLIHNVRECIGCGISRLEMPYIREYFEQKVMDFVLAKYPDKKTKLIITDFASGNLFQIFVIVNKLAALGYTNIRLNLIDLEFKSVINRYRSMLEKSPAPKLRIEPGTFELTDKDSDAIFNLSRGFGQTVWGPQNFDVALEVLYGILTDTEYNNTFAHFSQWFNGTGLNLELVVYADAGDYLADCKVMPELKGDLLLGVDYFTDIQDVFEDLRKNSLKDTGMAFGLNHSDVEDNPQAAEFYFSLGTQKQPSMKIFEWDLKSKKLNPVQDLPGTLEYHISQARLAELFKEA